jgi:hypothetical protein
MKNFHCTLVHHGSSSKVALKAIMGPTYGPHPIRLKKIHCTLVDHGSSSKVALRNVCYEVAPKMDLTTIHTNKESKLRDVV